MADVSCRELCFRSMAPSYCYVCVCWEGFATVRVEGPSRTRTRHIAVNTIAVLLSSLLLLLKRSPNFIVTSKYPISVEDMSQYYCSALFGGILPPPPHLGTVCRIGVGEVEPLPSLTHARTHPRITGMIVWTWKEGVDL